MRTGLDRLLDSDALRSRLLRGRLGFLTHPAAVARDMTHAVTALRARGHAFDVLFGPEHGYGGEAQDMATVADARDAHGTLVRSLYGDRFEDLIPKDEDLALIDTLLVDLQDVGSRYYTFVWTAVCALRACAKRGVRVVVLDRPNPIGGARESLEGRLQEPRCRSFVGLEPTPIRHGLTLGEIVAWRREAEALPAELLTVVRCEWDRGELATSWDRPFVMPSPNMPTASTALVYPGGCLVEGTNLSEGRGTTRPFEIVGAPWVDGERLAAELRGTKLPGFVARPLVFLPTFHKHAQRPCGGVQLHVTDGAAFRPVATYVALIACAARAAPDDFRFRTERYEFVDDIPAFDLLTGDARARERILAGDAPIDVACTVATLRTGEAELWDRARAAALACAS
ncbi:MAG TPA: DUF1343 domain-containing protein [Polyangiaceae bacterium]|nr:DUF1343 domain-containing protein [Polyangiaceae bacterium]